MSEVCSPSSSSASSRSSTCSCSGSCGSCVLELRAPAPVPPQPRGRRRSRAGARVASRAQAGRRRRAAPVALRSSSRRRARARSTRSPTSSPSGAAAGCGVVLDDDTFVSPVHARAVPARTARRTSRTSARRNGTLVNGERSPTRHPLRPRRPGAVRPDRRGGRCGDMRLVIGAATDEGQVREGNEDGYLVDRRLQLVRGRRRHGRPPRRRGRERDRARGAARRGRQRATGSATRSTDANDGRATPRPLTDTEPAGHGHHAHRGPLADGGTLLVGHVGDSRAYLLRDGELAPAHHRPQPGRGARPRRRLTEERGRGAPAAVDHHPRARRRRVGRGRRVPGAARARRPAAALLRRAHRHGAADDIAATLRRESDPTRARQPARRRRERRRRRGQHHASSVGRGRPTRPPVRPRRRSPSRPIEAGETSSDAPRHDRAAATRRRARAARCGASGAACCCGRCRIRARSLGVAVGAVGWYARRTLLRRRRPAAGSPCTRACPGACRLGPDRRRAAPTLALTDLRPADAGHGEGRAGVLDTEDADAFVGRMRFRAATTTTTTTTPTTTSTVPTTTVPPTTPPTPAPATP